MALIILRQNRNTGFAKGISADTNDDKLPHGLLLDEYNQHPDKKLYNSIDSGRVADPTTIMLIITTASTELGGYAIRNMTSASSPRVT